jgi:hypothetical protein
MLALPLVLLAFHASIVPLTPALRSELNARAFDAGCPVPLSNLRVLTVTHYGLDRRVRQGQLVVSARWAEPLAQVFRRLYALRFPIRHLRLVDSYGPPGDRPTDGDVSGAFWCRQAVASPCTGTAVTGTGHWSMHAYGEAIDLNPLENPYVGCGRTRDAASKPFLDRSHLRPGMVTPAVVAAFRAIGWGWGGAWTHSTRDYMHFSSTGH